MNDDLLDLSWDEFLEPAWKPVEAGEMEIGTPVKLYEFTRGTRESMARDATNLQSGSRKYQQRNLPLECWEFWIKGIEDSYEFWAAYHGVMGNKASVTRWRKRRARQRTQR